MTNDRVESTARYGYSLGLLVESARFERRELLMWLETLSLVSTEQSPGIFSLQQGRAHPIE
jgi:hypothetical protein